MSLLKTLTDAVGNIIYPATHAKAVFIEKSDGTVTDLQTYIDEIMESISENNSNSGGNSNG